MITSWPKTGPAAAGVVAAPAGIAAAAGPARASADRIKGGRRTRTASSSTKVSPAAFAMKPPAPARPGGENSRARNTRAAWRAEQGMTTFPVHKTDEQWRAELTPEEYAVLRQAGTERPWTGEYNETKTTGIYSCRACGADLFESETKFDSHCGWPSFYAPRKEDAVVLREDNSLGMRRVEVLCASCGSHLGHVFEDAPQTPTGDRFCMNSVSLRLKAAEEPQTP